MTLPLWKCWLPLLTVALIAGGCATTPPAAKAPLPDADWRTMTGQLRYRGERVSLIGDVIIRWKKNPPDREAMTMEFSKGGATLIKVSRDRSNAWATGPLARPKYSGDVSRLPAPLEGWLGAPVHEINRLDRSGGRLFASDPALEKVPNPRESFDFQLNP